MLLIYNFNRPTVEHIEDNDQKETDDKSKSNQHIEVCTMVKLLYTRYLWGNCSTEVSAIVRVKCIGIFYGIFKKKSIIYSSVFF